VSHPDALPDLFLDRSLGRIKVPRLLREAGLRLVTLAEHYGVPADEIVADEEWLELAGNSGSCGRSSTRLTIRRSFDPAKWWSPALH
jgi:PIN like domain